MPLTKIVPMRLGRFSVFDDRDLSDLGIGEMTRLCGRGNRRLLVLAEKDGVYELCGAPGGKFYRGLELYATRTDPDQTWQEFVRAGGLIEGDSDMDPLKPFMLLSVFLDGEPRGKFTIINMDLEIDNPAMVEGSGYGIYLSDADTIGEMLRESAFFMREFLDRDIRMEDGRILDIVQWNFPTDLPWLEDDDPAGVIAKTILGGIREAGTAETRIDGTDGIGVVRRRSAPRPIPVPFRVTDRDPELPDRVEIPEETDRDIPNRMGVGR